MKKILFLSLCCLLSSCEDFLDVEPDQQISVSEQLATAEGVNQIVSGIYRDLTLHMSSARIFTYGDVIPGNMAFTPNISNAELIIPSVIDLTYQFENTPRESDFNSLYNDGYNIVNQLNIVLENLNNFDFYDDLQLQELEAEMLAIRAFMHYRHTLLFSQNFNFSGDGSHLGIVYNTRTLTAGVDFPSRATLSENYESIKTDLDNALPLFTDDAFLQQGPSRSYFNRISTKGIYAQIALQMNDWQTAADLAQEVIVEANVPLLTSNDYLSEWQRSELPMEYLLTFTAPRDEDGEVGSSVGLNFLYNSANDYDRYSASNELIALHDNDDIRLGLYIPIPINTLTNGNQVMELYYFNDKYVADSDAPYLRLTEVLFIRAEALERLSPGNTESLGIINLIRNRVGLQDLPAGSNLLEEILKERRLELAFENSYFYDLVRYGQGIERGADCQLYTNICQLNYPSPFFILPLPADSIENNENMIQNEGY